MKTNHELKKKENRPRSQKKSRIAPISNNTGHGYSSAKSKCTHSTEDTWTDNVYLIAFAPSAHVN